MKSPRTVKPVRQFLGLAGHFRKHVKDYAKIAEPLTRLTKKNIEWFWGGKQESAVQQIKNILVTGPLLTIFDPKLDTELHTVLVR